MSPSNAYARRPAHARPGPLTEAQRDGWACIYCESEQGGMVPVPVAAPGGVGTVELFAHPRCRRDPTRPGHGAIATPWPDGAERWGDARGRDAVVGRLLGIRSNLEGRELLVAQDWSAGWAPAPDISAELAAAEQALAAARAKVDAALEELAPRVT